VADQTITNRGQQTLEKALEDSKDLKTQDKHTKRPSPVTQSTLLVTNRWNQKKRKRKERKEKRKKEKKKEAVVCILRRICLSRYDPIVVGEDANKTTATKHNHATQAVAIAAAAKHSMPSTAASER
jgi:hypothetical protein